MDAVDADNVQDAEVAAVADRFARFARDEAPGRSELYAEWASGVASDAVVQRALAPIAPTRRQPPLVFAITRLLGAPESPYPQWRAWLLAHTDAVVAEAARRSLQTNEPLRCAALLPALSRIPGPIALLEIGASAGLCLYPDRYSYRYRGARGTVAVDPPGGPASVVLECEVSGERMPALAHPDIVWRGGVDLSPLDPADPDTEAWLTGLVWPGELGRAERVRDALRIAASDPPTLLAGDGAARLDDLAAMAPRGATLVVQTPGVLAHIPWRARTDLIDRVRAIGRWVTLDAPGLHTGWNAPVDEATWPGGFALALDGDVLAAADPLGGWLHSV